MSDPANWSGGSPANDPDATLVFTSDAERFDVYNDVPGLRFKSIRFEYQGYTLAGASLASTDGTMSGFYDARILCDLSIAGTLTVSGGSATGLDFAGAISGSGGVSVEFGSATFSGSSSNTYSGETVLSGANLRLRKTGGIAIPGNVRSVQQSTLSRLFIERPEQIADSATVSIADDTGELSVANDETIRVLRLGRYAFDAASPLPTLTVDSLETTGQAEIRTNLRLTQGVLELPSGASLTVGGKLFVPASGIRLHGAGNASLGGDYSAPTVIDGVHTQLTAANSSVQMTSGALTGAVASLAATGGAISTGLVSSGDVRLGPNVTVHAFPGGFAAHADVELNGTLDLADAMLDLQPPTSFTGVAVVIIRNSSTQPVIGTFKGLPEGAVAFNRWRVTYHGGDGNDVAVTELPRAVPSISIKQDPATAFIGEPVTFTATVAGSAGVPTGTVTFGLNGNADSLGSAPLVAGVASLQTTLSAPASAIYVRYSGDSVYRGGDVVGAGLTSSYRKPVITSIDPAEATAGTTPSVTIRGTNFAAGSRVAVPAIAATTQVISSTEIHTTLDLSSYRLAATLPISVITPDGKVVSDPVSFAVRAVPEPPSPLQIEDAAVSMTVTPGAKTAWISTDTDFRNTTNFLADDDGDGVVRWTWPGKVPEIVIGAIDLTSGTYAIRGRGNAVPDVQPFASHTFVADAAGNVSRFAWRLSDDFASTNWTFLWGRPGVGAWRMSLSDGQDDDARRNGILFGSLSAMQPLGGSPPHPAGLLPGDVLIVVPRLARGIPVRVFAAHFGAELGESAPGVLETLERGWSFREDAGVARLTVMRTGGASGTASVRYRTVDRTAVGGVHFVPTTGTLTFAPGETLKSFDIPLINDASYGGGSHVFDVALFDAAGATLGEATEFVVGIDDDDPPPVVSIVGPDQRRVIEGSGPSTFPIHLTLTGATSVTATIRWTATGLPTPQSGYVIFQPGERQKTVFITIPGNKALGAQSRILVDFLAQDGTNMSGRFVTLIVDDGDRPHVRASDVFVGEKAGTAHLTLTIDPPPAAGAVIPYYFKGDGTATAGTDYVATSGTAVFAPGQSQQTINVTILDDAVLEGDEVFYVSLDDAGRFFLERSAIPVVIVDDELTARPQVSISGAAIAEGNDVASVSLEVRLSEASTKPVSVRYTTTDGTAMAGADYQPLDDVLTFAPGQTLKTIAIPIFGDTRPEGEKTFLVTLSAPLNATLDVARATVTIMDDDVARPARRRSSGH